MFIDKFKYLKQNSLVGLTILILLCFMLRLGLPQYVKFVLFPSVLVLSVYSFFVFFKNFSKNQISTLSNIKFFIPVILVILVYIVSYIFTNGKQIDLLKDGFNNLLVILFTFSLFAIFNRSKDFWISLKYFQTLAFIGGSIMAFFGIVKLVFKLYGIEFEFLSVEKFGYPLGTSLSVDDNFYTLTCLIAIILGIPYLFKQLKFYRSLLVQFAIFVLLLSIFFATSRRGLIITTTLLSTLLIVWLVSLLLRVEKFYFLRRNTILLLFLTGITASVYYYVIYRTTNLDRNRWLVNSTLNHSEVNDYLNWLTLSGKSIFKGESNYYEVKEELWSTNFDSRFPYAGWADGNYQLIKKIEGEGNYMLPKNSQGALIDNREKGSAWSGNAYYYSNLFDKRIEKGKRYVASIYCYVSPEFNGEWVRLSSHGRIKGLTASYFNLKQKGKWQKLETSFEGDTGSFKTYFYLCKSNSLSLDSLCGHVIYAYPELKEMEFDSKNPYTWAGAQFDSIFPLKGLDSTLVPKNTVGFRFSDNSHIYRNNLIYSTSRLFTISNLEKNERAVISIYTYVSNDFNGDEVFIRASGKYSGFGSNKYNIKNKGKWEKLYLSVTPEEDNVEINFGIKKNTTDSLESFNGNVYFAYPQIERVKFDSNLPITWAATKFKEVKSLNGSNSEIIPKSAKGYLIDNESEFHLSKKTNKYYLYSKLWEKYLPLNKRCITSVYCFVSEDFNGEKVMLGKRGKKIFGTYSSLYDFNKKGTWQKLIINNYTYNDTIEPFLFFEIPKNYNKEYLKGYVIFASPSYTFVDYSPTNPSTYSVNDFKMEQPITGENSEIVPKGCIGYKLDKSAKGKVWKNIYYTSTDYLSLPVDRGDSVVSSVFCYVSEDFNGNEVRVEIKGKFKGNIRAKYDLNNKGKWVKIIATGVATETDYATGLLFFSQKDAKDFSLLKGYVTFAYPELNVIKKKSKQLSYHQKNYLVNKASLFSLSIFKTDTDARIENIESDSLVEIPVFQREMVGDNFSGPRIDRWRLAIHIYVNEYSWWQRIIGGGFGYTRKFAKEFHDPDEYDYPHNPFLSVLLYSGLVGLIFYVGFLLKALHYYWIYRKEYWTLGLAFGASFFYAFFSANSPFEPAILGMLTIIPYFIHYFSINEKTSINE